MKTLFFRLSLSLSLWRGAALAAAFALLTACGGGGGGGGGGDTAGPSTNPDVTNPGGGNPGGGNPGGGNPGGGNPGGGNPDPMPDPSHFTSTQTFVTVGVPTTFSTVTTAGGYGRVNHQTAQSTQNAAIVVIAPENIAGRLMDPANIPIMSTIYVTVNATASSFTIRSTIAPLPGSGVYNFESGERVYIDGRVAIGYHSPTNPFVTIGEPYVRPDSGLTAGTYLYVGRIDVARNSGGDRVYSNILANFDVVFGAGNASKISMRSVDFNTRNHGVMQFSNIPIDVVNGTFHSADGGMISVQAGKTSIPIIDQAAVDSGFVVFGQFHGMDATGLSGGFHSNNHQVFGAFASGNKRAN